MKKTKKALKLDSRRKIYSFISKNPGLHLREISRRTNIPKSTINYHINYLEKLGLITEKIEGEFKYIYASKKIGSKDKEILGLLRKEIPCKIFLYLIFSLACSQSDLCKELELSPSTISYHIKKMIDMEIIEEARVKDGKIYPYNDNREMLRKPVGTEKFYKRKNQEIIDATYRLLITNKHSLFNEEIIDSYAWYLEDMEEKKAPQRFKPIDKYISSSIDFILNIFKPPFAS